MTNPYEPPIKRAFDDAELALAIEGAADALAAMSVLEEQAKLRADDAAAYVAWVRKMETEGSAEAKRALAESRRAKTGIAEEEEQVVESKDDSSWQKMIPDWEERKEAQARATAQAIEDAKREALEKAEVERAEAVAAAIAEAEAEASRLREEALEKVRQEAAEKIAAELAAAEELRKQEQERLAEEARVAEEVRIAEEARVAEESRVAEEERQAEEIRLAEEQRLLEAQRIAEEVAAAELAAAELAVAEEIAQEELVAEEPTPVSAADYATGSFDIIESAEQAVDEEEDNFDYVSQDGELAFAREPKSGAIDKPLSTIARRSKAISQLFVWGGLTVGVAPLALAAYVSHLGNAGDGILAIAIGFLFSSAIISVAAIAGKRSGLSTLILARAAFGVHGNLVSAIPLVIIKLVFGAAALYAAVNLFDGMIVGLPAIGDPIDTLMPLATWQLVGFAALLFVGGVLAFFGGKVLYWAQLVVGAFGAVAIICFVATTAGSLKLDVLVFSMTPDFALLTAFAAVVGVFFGAFWVTAVAEFTRKIPMRESGVKVSTFVALATGVLPLLISSYALLVFKSAFDDLRIGTLPILDEVLRVLPQWTANVLLYSAIATALIWVASWMYATSVSFAAIGSKLHPAISQPIILVLSLAIAVFAAPYIDFDFMAVVILSWAGIFAADVAIRRIAYHEVSLARDYGFYRAWNWVNIVGFIMAVALGFGLVAKSEGMYSWMGYITDAYSAVGVFIAPLFAFLFPVLFGRARIKAQESEVVAIESRRNDLNDVEVI